MKVLLHLSVRGVRAHGARSVLAVIAVTIGVALTAGTLSLTATLSARYTGLVDAATADVDLVVRYRQPFGEALGALRLPEGTVDELAAVTGVADAAPFVLSPVAVIDDQRQPVTSPQSLSLMVGWVANPSLNPLRVLEGRAPSGPGEVVIDAGTARRSGISLGEEVDIAGLAGTSTRSEVVGLVGFGAASSLAGTTFAAVDIAVAQRIAGVTGQIDAVIIGLDDDADQQAVLDAIAAELPEGFGVERGEAFRDQFLGGAEAAVGFLPLLLQAFAVLGIVLGGLVIANTLAITGAQRGSEVSLLRAVGATRHQVLAAMLTEAVLLGFIATGLGLAAGHGVVRMLLELVAARSVTVPGGTVVYLGSPALVAAVVGIATTLIAALTPAVRASRMSPIEGLAVGRMGAPPDLVRRTIVGAALTCGGIALALYGLSQIDATTAVQPFQLTGLAIVATFAGGVLLAGPSARLVSHSVAGAARRIGGVAAEVGVREAERNPRRTGTTAAALLCGIAASTTVVVLVGSLRSTVESRINTTLRADLVATAARTGGLVPATATAIGAHPGVTEVITARVDKAAFDGDPEFVMGIDFARLGEAVRIDVEAGSPVAGPGEILVSRDEAREGGWRLGSVVEVVSPEGGTSRARVAGVLRHGLAGPQAGVDYLQPLEDFDAAHPGDDIAMAFISVAADADPSTVRGGLQATLAESWPAVDVYDRASFVDTQAEPVDEVAAIADALLVLVIALSAISLANTLLLSITSRTRELSLLRIIGSSRSQLRRSIRAEGLLVAVVGTTLGVTIGLFAGWALTSALRHLGIDGFAPPVSTIAAFALLMIGVSFLATELPALRAARTDLLAGIRDA